MKGTYSLLVHLPKASRIQVGKLGEIDFEEGAYAYIGSALNNLEGRIERHLREEKNLHWHIDYLLTRAEVGEVLYGEGSTRKECYIAEDLAESLPSIEGFGSSDCRCGSHLFYSDDVSELCERVASSFRRAGLDPKRW